VKALAGIVIAAATMLAGCASGYGLVKPGTVPVNALEVDVGAGWNRVPGSELPWAWNQTQVWTQNGLSLDRLVLIPGIEDGDSIYFPNDAIDYPLFRTDMTDAGLVELVGRTIELAQGANRTEVTTSAVRPQRFGDVQGVLFDLEAAVHDGPAYLGSAGAFVSDGCLFLVYFLAASPWYYEQQSASALATIVSARH
jgi:hypothetical protein